MKETIFGNYVLPEHVHIDINGRKSWPVFLPSQNKWYLGSRAVTLTELGDLCNISEQDLIVLKLKYGG